MIPRTINAPQTIGENIFKVKNQILLTTKVKSSASDLYYVNIVILIEISVDYYVGFYYSLKRVGPLVIEPVIV